MFGAKPLPEPVLTLVQSHLYKNTYFSVKKMCLAKSSAYFALNVLMTTELSEGIILCMRSANERLRDNVTSSINGWAHVQNDHWTFGHTCL